MSSGGASGRPGLASRLAGGLEGGWKTLAGTGAAASLALAALTAASVFLALALPRSALALRDQALQQTLAALPRQSTVVIAAMNYTQVPVLGPVATSDMAAELSVLRGNLTRIGLPLAPRGGDWAGLTAGLAPFTVSPPSVLPAAARHAGPPQLEVIFRDPLSSHARLLAGHLPGQRSVPGQAGQGGQGGQGGARSLQVAVTAATAARFGLHVGSRLRLDQGTALTVTAIIRPADPRSAFWTEDPIAAAPALYSQGPASVPYWAGAVFIGPGQVGALEQAANTSVMTLSWCLPVRLGQLTAGQVPALQGRLAEMTASAGDYLGEPAMINMYTGLENPLAVFAAADQAVRAILGLLQVSLAVLGALVVLLGARLIGSRREAELALMRARGAGLAQLAVLALRGGAAVVVPAAAVAALAAVAVTPGASDPLGWWLAGLTMLAALAGPPVLIARQHVRATRQLAGRGAGDAAGPARLAARRRRGGRLRRGRPAGRLVAEITLVCLSVGGLVLLRQQGQPASGLDLYSAAAPVLVAIPAAVLVMRLLPVALRAASRLTARRRGVVGFVGLTSSARSSLLTLLPAVAMVLGLTVIAFATMVLGAVQRGESTAAWRATGADAVISGASPVHPLTAAVSRAVAAVPGVQRTLLVTGEPGITPAQTPVTVAAVNMSRYAQMIAGTPLPQVPPLLRDWPGRQGRDGRPGSRRPGLPVPVLASPGTASLLGRGAATIRLDTGLAVRVRVAGTIDIAQAAMSAGPFVLLPAQAAGRLHLAPTALLISGASLDTAALRATVARLLPGATLSLRSAALAQLASAPLSRAGSAAFAQGAAGAAGFSTVTLLIAVLLGARSRELALARLATMGLSRRQAAWTAVVEAAPAIVAAAAGGLACARVLVPLVGPALNLSVFTGAALAVPVQAELTAVAAAAAGLLAVAIAALAGQVLVAARRGSTYALRAGE